MNDYALLVAHAAAKFTGRSAVLSPLLDSYCGWENKKSRFSSEPTKEDFRIILSAGGLLCEELKIDVVLKITDVHPKTKYEEREGNLNICMQHDSKKLGEDNFNWSRDCTYKYQLSIFVTPLAHNLAAYWTDDDFLAIQAREIESPFAEESGVKGILEFRLIPIEVIDVLEPAMNVPFLKQILKAIKKKSSDVFSYVNAATEISEANDVLSLLSCIPLMEGKKTAFDLDIEAGQSSQDESETDTSLKSETDPPISTRSRKAGDLSK